MDIKASGGETLLTGSARDTRRGFPLKKSTLGVTAAGRDLSSYRRTAFPARVSSGINAVERGRGVGGGAESGGSVSRFGEVLFRSRQTGGSVAGGSVAGGTAAGGISGVGGGFVRGVGGDGGGIGVGQRAAALRRTGGILSERFLGSNPLLSPAPVSLPSLELGSVGGGVVGLPNGEIGGGDLSVDLLRALQKYRVAAEVQG